MNSEKFYAEYNLMIWRVNDTTRRVWEYSSYDGRLVQYEDQGWKKYRGRWGWSSHLNTTWSNPEFSDGPGSGRMEECPELPLELAQLHADFVKSVPAKA